MRVLLVKLSSLGDVVHAAPVVHDILVAHPGALIDWVVEPAFAPLVRRIEGIAEVIECPLRRWRNAWWTSKTRAEWRVFKQRLQREPYDAVIDLQGLTKSAWIASRARGRSFGLGNATEGSSYEMPARWLVDKPIPIEPHIHALDRSRVLAARALGYTLQGPPHHGLKTRPVALGKRTVVFVHGSSREDKQWHEARWVGLGRRFVENGWHIALPQGNEMEMVRAERLAAQIDSEITAFVPQMLKAGPVVHVWPSMKLDMLTDRMAACSGVVGVDSGLSHIAVALGLPHLQLYNHPTAWRTGPLPAHGRSYQVSVGGDTVPALDTVWAEWLRVKKLAAASAAPAMTTAGPSGTAAA